MIYLLPMVWCAYSSSAHYPLIDWTDNCGSTTFSGRDFLILLLLWRATLFRSLVWFIFSEGNEIKSIIQLMFSFSLSFQTNAMKMNDPNENVCFYSIMHTQFKLKNCCWKNGRIHSERFFHSYTKHFSE